MNDDEERGDACPRCGCSDFQEFDCGPDSYDDDIFYVDYRCQRCGLTWDGWAGGWYVTGEDRGCVQPEYDERYDAAKSEHAWDGVAP